MRSSNTKIRCGYDFKTFCDMNKTFPFPLLYLSRDPMVLEASSDNRVSQGRENHGSQYPKLNLEPQGTK